MRKGIDMREYFKLITKMNFHTESLTGLLKHLQDLPNGSPESVPVSHVIPSENSESEREESISAFPENLIVCRWCPRHRILIKVNEVIL